MTDVKFEKITFPFLNETKPTPATGFSRPLKPYEQRMADAAKHASEKAIREAFAAGLSIRILHKGWVVDVAPDGTVTPVEKFERDD